MLSYGIDPVKKEIKGIRRAANCIGAAYAFIFVIDYLLEYSVKHSYEFAGFIYKIANDPVYDALFQISFSFLVFIPPYILAAHAAGKTAAVAEFRRPQKGTALPLILMGVGICQIGEIATNLFANAMYTLGSEPVMSDVTYGTDLYGVIFAIVSTAVIPALVEEFAMRGVALGLLRPYGEGFAILFSSIIFGLMHRNLVQAPFAFVVGMGLGFVAVKGGSVFLAIAVHFINNLMSVGFYYLNLHLNSDMQSAAYCCYAIVALMLGVFGLLLYKDKKELMSLGSPSGECSFARKTAAFFTSPFMIAAVVLTVNEIFKIQEG